MTMPKKGTRKIVVDGGEYRWILTTKRGFSPDHYHAVIELADSPRSTLVVYLIGLDINYVDYNRGDPITPKDIEAFILKALATGWQPDKKGPTFYLGRPSDSNRKRSRPTIKSPTTVDMIGPARKSDRDAIRGLYLAAFPESERELIANLAVELLAIESEPETINLVDEIDGELAGHVAFSPVTMETDTNCRAYILAPLAVKPFYQKIGIGSDLVRTGIQLLQEQAVDYLLVYGDPKYYSRFGFETELATRFVPPYELEFPFGWQAMRLRGNEVPVHPLKFTCVEPLQNPALW